MGFRYGAMGFTLGFVGFWTSGLWIWIGLWAHDLELRVYGIRFLGCRVWGLGLVPRPSIYPLLDPKCPLFGAIYPYLRAQGGSWGALGMSGFRVQRYRA